MRARGNRVLPIVLVSDRARWLRGLRASCKALDVVPECESWASAETRRWPVAALVLDLTLPFEPKRSQLGEWAGRGWQPVCVLCISPQRGAAEFEVWARARGYHRMLHGARPSEYRAELGACLEEVVDRRLRLVVELAKALEVTDPEVLRALTLGMAMIPEHNTVGYWSDELGLGRRQRLARLFRRRCLPPPKRMLGLLRLARVVECATGPDQPVTQVELARRLGYSDASYLRRVARALTGQSLSWLLEGGPDRFFEVVADSV